MSGALSDLRLYSVDKRRRATGMFGIPRVPEFEHGADVTMIQRSSTHVVKSETLMELGLVVFTPSPLSNPASRQIADLIFGSVPYTILPAFQIPVYKQIAERDAEFYERLTKAGFLLDFGEDGSGLFMKYLRRGSGYYIDVGASELIAEGKIRLKSGVSIERIKERSVVLTDGTELPADLIVYATGYGSMNDWAARLISQDVADKVGKCWGLTRVPLTTLVRGKANCVTCGSRRINHRRGFMLAICINRVTTRNSYLCKSRRVWKAFRLQSMVWATYTT